MKEDQVKTMGPGSSVIWPVVEVEMVIITCLERTSVTDGLNKKVTISWGHMGSAWAMRRPSLAVAVLGFCFFFFCFFVLFKSLGFWVPPTPLQVQADWSGEKTAPGQHTVKGPELGWQHSPVMTLLGVICSWKSTGNMIMRPVIGRDKLEISQ